MHREHTYHHSDFNEDTPDGKWTLHATATALYQRLQQTGDSQTTNTNGGLVASLVACSAQNTKVGK